MPSDIELVDDVRSEDRVHTVAQFEESDEEVAVADVDVEACGKHKKGAEDCEEEDARSEAVEKLK